MIGTTRPGSGFRPVIFLAASLALGLSLGCAHSQHGPDGHASHTSGHEATSQAKPGSLAAEFGIELVTLRAIAGGHLLDLRYKVVDADKAHQVLRAKSKVDITLVNKETGQTAQIPHTMLGKLRVKAPRSRPDRVYYALFGNPGMNIRSGSTVEIRFGDVVVDGWKVM